jgi:TrmH family RNA methyltransferase
MALISLVRASPRVRAAGQLAKRAFRERSRLFLAEGPQAVREALRRPGTVTELFITADSQRRHADLAGLAAGLGVPVHQVTAAVMTGLAQTVTPQGVVAVCRFVDVSLDVLLGRGPRLLVILANVRDPGNAGTVLRTADAAGTDGVIFADASVDPYNGKCVRSSAGSLFHVPVVTGVPARVAAARIREAGLTVLAADGRAAARLDDDAAARLLARPAAWLFGNEAWGRPEEIRQLADCALAVPVYGRAESLNLAAAAAVCLYASARAQRQAG